MQRYPEKSNKQNNRSMGFINSTIYHLPNATLMEMRHFITTFNFLDLKRKACNA